MQECFFLIIADQKKMKKKLKMLAANLLLVFLSQIFPVWMENGVDKSSAGVPLPLLLPLLFSSSSSILLLLLHLLPPPPLLLFPPLLLLHYSAGGVPLLGTSHSSPCFTYRGDYLKRSCLMQPKPATGS